MPEIDEDGPKTVRIPEEYITYFDPSVEKHVKCSNCLAPLFSVIEKSQSTKITKLTCLCPHCGDKSFTVQINGEFFFGNTDYSVSGEIDFVKLERAADNRTITYCEAVVHARKIKEWSK